MLDRLLPGQMQPNVTIESSARRFIQNWKTGVVGRCGTNPPEPLRNSSRFHQMPLLTGPVLGHRGVLQRYAHSIRPDRAPVGKHVLQNSGSVCAAGEFTQDWRTTAAAPIASDPAIVAVEKARARSENKGPSDSRKISQLAQAGVVIDLLLFALEANDSPLRWVSK
jgi:hypothetical protein